MITLVRDSSRSYHVSLDTVGEFENSLGKGFPDARSHETSLLLRRLWKLSRKFRVSGLYAAAWRSLLGNETKEHASFVVMMGLDERKIATSSIRHGSLGIYLFDAWPSRYGEIAKVIRRWDVDHVFVSSSQSAIDLASMCPWSKVEWIPEGISLGEYSVRPSADKDIDVLQLGRKHDGYHEAITDGLQRAGKTYLYEREKSQIIFPSREEFIQGLARSKISICFPSSVTHPERAGGVETMTIRYLQSMASKCLILGHAPAEIIDLFGYCPVVEVDWKDPTGQVLGILENYSSYDDLIERNYLQVQERHTWKNRWTSILGYMELDPIVKV